MAQDDNATSRPAAGRVFTTPPGNPFLDILAQAILAGELPSPDGAKPSPIDLTHMTLLMPTRRAQRALSQAFLKAGNQRAMLLPNIRPISQQDDELALLTRSRSASAAGAPVAQLDAPDAIDPISRILVLTRLVDQWSRTMRSAGLASDETMLAAASAGAGAGARTPAQAVHMAQELVQLMDLVEAEGLSLGGIEDIVPDELTHHWKLTLDFLKIVTQYWPAQLEELGLASPWELQNQSILSEAARISKSGSTGPLIVAGVTGSIPATVELMKAVLGLEQGAIVLPGLDLSLDDESFDAISPDHAEHPQFGFRNLLAALGVDRRDVVVLPSAPDHSGERAAQLAARAQFVSEAMRPASTTAKWHGFTQSADAKIIARGLSGVSLIETKSSFEEAELVALIMREVAEQPDKTAALVSPDRNLARRVASRLKSWRIEVDDSAGRPFVKTVSGSLLDLVIACVAHGFAPNDVVALLKHPLCRFGLSAREVRFGARALEIAVFRTTYIGRGLDGLEAALSRARSDVASGERREAAVRRLREADFERAADLITRMREGFNDLCVLFASHERHTLSQLARAHLAAGETACQREPAASTQAINGESFSPEAGVPPPEDGAKEAASALFERESGSFAAESFSRLVAQTDMAPHMRAGDYPEFYRTLIGRQNIRERSHVHPRLFIWGPIEARLQHADVMILGGLNEGVWPDVADPGPWLNRPMRKAIGLPAPEEGTGRKAFDFTSFLHAPDIYLTRSMKVEGDPAVPSRWLLRMKALLAGLGLEHALDDRLPWLSWARARDTATPVPRAPRPRPTPALKVRPRRLSVSNVETLLGNPYAIYASKILGLEPLAQLGATPDAALRGAVVHGALARFCVLHPSALPQDALHTLNSIARDILSDFSNHPRVGAIWLPQFERFARWFCDTEPARREGLKKTYPEVSGTLTFEAPRGAFELTARADRIDVTNSGLVITDYKTGAIPKQKSVLEGSAPQLPLEAAIALEGGFSNVSDRQISALRYISASGREPAGEETTISTDDPSDLARKTFESLVALVSRFDNETTAYACLRRPDLSYRFDAYAHLARIEEWLGAEGGGEEEADA